MNDRPSADGSPSDEGTRAARESTPPASMIGPYRLLQRLGEGGMGEVWLAEQTRPVRRQVALKVIKAGMDTAQVVSRFAAERQALALMAHPAIAQVFEAGETPQGRPYFVMEYVRGEAITTYSNRQNLSTRQRIDLFLQVCDGVHHAHQKGIIHRDLKPSNILVTVLDELPVPKIIDFGLAKATAQPLTERTLFTELGVLIGTPEYMSPEQAEMTGLDIDTRTDVYALGVILFELLTGVLPFDAKALREQGLAEMRRTIRHTDPPRPSTRIRTNAAATTPASNRRIDAADVARELRGDLDWIILRALEKDRTRRYGSVSDLAADLERHRKNLPVLASPPSVRYRTSKFVRRHRLGVAVSATLAALLIAFAATAAVQARRIAHERDRANREAATAIAVNEFLQNDLLAQASPAQQGAGNPPDPDIKVRTLLDRAAARIQGKFDANPRVEASIRATIGEAYRSLGLYAEAVVHLQRGLNLVRSVVGDEHPETLTTARMLGEAHYFAGNYALAESVLAPTVETSRRVMGTANRETREAMSTLGQTYIAQAKYALAQPLLLETLEVQRRVEGAEHPLTLDVTSSLARLYNVQANVPEAERLLKSVLEGRTRTSGADHPFTLTALNNLAVVYQEQYRFADAEPLLLRVLEGNRRVRGVEHPSTLDALQNLAVLYLDSGRVSQAEPLFSSVLETKRRLFGAEHPKMLTVMRNLALLYSYEKRFSEAVPLIEKTVETSRRTLGSDHPDTLLNRYIQAFIYRDQGRYAAAETLLREVLEAQRRINGPKHPRTASTMDGLGFVLVAQRDHVEAEPVLRECLAIRHASMPGDFRQYATQAALGASLAGQGRRAEAESLLIQAYEGMRERQGKASALNHFRMISAGKWIIQLYEQSGEAAKAAEWRQRVEQDRRALQEM